MRNILEVTATDWEVTIYITRQQIGHFWWVILPSLKPCVQGFRFAIAALADILAIALPSGFLPPVVPEKGQKLPWRGDKNEEDPRLIAEGWKPFRLIWGTSSD